MGQSSENAFPASAPVSPALFSAALALSGHWDEIPVLSGEYLGVTNPVVIILSLGVFLLVPVSAMNLANLYAKKTTKKTLRTAKRVSILLPCVCAFCLLVNVPTAIVSYRAKQANDMKVSLGSYRGWYLLQYDETFPVSEFNVTPEWTNIDDAYYLEIVWDWQRADNFDIACDARYGDDYQRRQSVPTLRAQGSVPWLYDVYEFVARWEISAEKRYLLAIPESEGGRLILNDAAWYDLNEEKMIRLKIHNDPNDEKHCYLDLIPADRK